MLLYSVFRTHALHDGRKTIFNLPMAVGNFIWCILPLSIFFVTKFAVIKLIVAFCINDINNSLAMIGIRAMCHHIFRALPCKNCFVYSMSNSRG